MQTVFNETKAQAGVEFDILLQIADGHGFSIAEDNRQHGHLILYAGDSVADYQIHATGYSNPEHLNLQIVRYLKKFSRQPIGAEADKVERLPLFIGQVDPSDHVVISAILQATVGSF